MSRHLAALAIAGLLCAGCSPAAEEASPSTAATPPDAAQTAAAVAQPDAMATPQSQIVVGNGAPETTIGSGGDPGATETQQRISDLLTDLTTRPGSSGSTAIVLPEAILFDFDRAALKAGANPTLANLAEVIGLSSDDEVVVEGHTDAKGSDAYNRDLSQRRAVAVRDALVANHGVAPDTLRAVGRGESQPVASDTNADGSDNPQGRQRNRRVEVLVDGIGDGG